MPTTRPYKHITITIHEDFVPRLINGKKGHWYRGTTSNLTLVGYLCFLFEVNEYLPKEHKMTDYQIAKLLVQEFPESDRMKGLLAFTTGLIPATKNRGNTLALYRQKYNAGYLRRNEGGREGPISFKYDSNGERISPHTNRPLSQEQYDAIIRRYGPDNRPGPDFDWEAVVKERSHPKKSRRSSYDSFDWCI